ncbi:hypothetical protein SESBI_18703 [Sesbania bispinosa]|nr:hypothetical protein SESBI_18703 [Sesbania bispinosa]
MGNCAFKGISSTVLDEEKMVVKVVTSNGGMMELCTPITVECITNEFPGHGIYRSRRDLFSEPLHHNEELQAGELYYLLPLNPFSREQLSEILSEESRTEELIESVRTVAKCGNGLPSVSNSDHLSVSSSSKGPISNNLGLDGYSYS